MEMLITSELQLPVNTVPGKSRHFPVQSKMIPQKPARRTIPTIVERAFGFEISRDNHGIAR